MIKTGSLNQIVDYVSHLYLDVRKEPFLDNIFIISRFIILRTKLLENEIKRIFL